MVEQLLGFEFRRKTQLEKENVSFSPPENDDGAMIVAAGGVYGTYVDFDGSVRTESELITKYRGMAEQPEIDEALDNIVNEAITLNEEEEIVKINLNDLNFDEQTKRVIESEFKEVLRLLDFNRKGYDIFKRWYVDGRLFFHAIVDEKNPELGIKELRYIDPRKIKKVKEVTRKKLKGAKGTGMDIPLVNELKTEYYIYNEKGFNSGNRVIPVTPSTVTTGLKIARDSIVYVTSGLSDINGNMVLSYLHKAIKPLNQVRTLEDAVVIYRLARAPERRVWYIDVGDLPKMKAEQYLRDIMIKHKNKLVYDASTGDIRDDRKFMTMLEDYWLPRRGVGGRGTEVDTLPAGQNLGEMADVEYFLKKLYKSLNVPYSRLDSDDKYVFANNATEISRDEIRFAKFITRLRVKFSELFLSILEKQLLLKNLTIVDDWKNVIEHNIKFNFTSDNYFSELKETQIITSRVQILPLLDPYVGKYLSHRWVRKHILRQTDEDMQEMDMEIAEEIANPQYNPPQMVIPEDGDELNSDPRVKPEPKPVVKQG
jgi:hypothetical protein